MEEQEGKYITFLHEDEENELTYKGRLIHGGELQMGFIEYSISILYEDYLISPQRFFGKASLEEIVKNKANLIKKVKKYEASLVGKREEGEDE